MICPNCNAHNIPNVANFCPNCGVTFDKRKLAAQKRKQKTRLKKEAEEAWERYPSKPKLRTNVYVDYFVCNYRIGHLNISILKDKL